jgi:tetratricopeptide (TPR) repeat protein
VTLTSGAVVAYLICAAALAPAQDIPDRLLAAANAAYRSLRAADAVDLYRQYLALYPDRADVRVYFGGALLNLDQLEAAFDQAQRAIQIDQRYAKGYVLAGRVCAAREQWNQAQNYLATAQRLDGRDADAWYFSGRAYYDANRFEQAIAVFEQALRIGAEQSRVYENLGLAQDALSQFSVAEKSFRKALELANGSWRPYLAYGAFLFRQDRPAESLRVLQQALTLAPAETDVRFELARVLYHEDNIAEAAEVLAPAKASNQCRVHNLLARIDSASGEGGLAEIEIKAMGNCKGTRENP